MSMYMVTYDLMKQGQNYTGLIAKLETYPTRWHPQGSVWMIKTEKSAEQVRNELAAVLDSNDKLIVARLSGEAAWMGYPADVSEWLKQNL